MCAALLPTLCALPHYTPYAVLATRQAANSLSAANKLRIRCAWAGTPAFASAGYGSGWAPESYIFADKASLQTAATEYDSNAAAATAKYGAIADWCVSRVTDMSWLFSNLRNFNADISGWDTSRVTDMSYMFLVRSSLRPRAPHTTQSQPASRPAACTPRYRMPPPASRPAARPAPCALLVTLGSWRRPSTSRWTW